MKWGKQHPVASRRGGEKRSDQLNRSPLELKFVETLKELVDVVRVAIASGARTVRIEPEAAATAFIQALGSGLAPFPDFVTTGGASRPPLPGMTYVRPDARVDLAVVAVWEPDAVATALMSFLDLEAGTVIAPVTERHFSKSPLFLISIPKAGTHLLMRLAEVLGYPRGGFGSSDPPPGQWNTIEQQDTHARAPDILDDMLRRHGLLDHPIVRSPALFIYRDPRDVLVSEANYYHRPGMHFSHGYLAKLSFRERLVRLIDDPWLLGSIRKRMADFAAWLDIPNVIPVSFEELVGVDGGGDDGIQRRVVWSVQLKLHAPGRTEAIARRLYDRDSPTFHAGQIGSWRKYFDREVQRRFGQLPQDFMRHYGYDPRGRGGPFPAHRETYRRRALDVVDLDIQKPPILIESAVNGCNIVRYRRRFFAIPMKLGPTHLDAWLETELDGLASDTELSRLLAKLS
jgi:hypothetical protein